MMENPLPPKYYHTNFEYLLSFVKDKYKNLLITSEWQFLRKYYSLPNDAQCLFIRFTNRKGLFFKKNTLKYEEIENIETQLQLLTDREFVSELNYDLHKNYLNDILYVLTKSDLLSLFDLNEFKNLKKEQLAEQLKEKYSPESIFETLILKSILVKANFELEVSFLRFLFFGNKYMDMTEFVLRDLGLIQYYQHSDDHLVARFETRKEAEEKWMISEMFLVFEELKGSQPPSEILDWYKNTQQSLQDISPVALTTWERLQLKIGKYFEQQKHFEAALEVYKNVMAVPSRERAARCLAKIGFIDEARVLCEQMISRPQNADEQFFGEYFIKNLDGKKNKKQTTEFIKNASEITVDKIFNHQVELGAIAYFREAGFDAAFSENHTWRSLFGLAFWDIIFDPTLVAFHHPFQRRPSDLHLPDFYQKRGENIRQHLDSFENKDEFLEYLWKNYRQNEGIANAFVIWLPEIWELVRVIVTFLDWENIKLILTKIAENIIENSRGLPDLMVWNENGLELIEIKSPNDALSNQQLFWLRYFNEIGVKASVLRVRFE